MNKIKCPVCNKEDKFELGYSRGIDSWLWFGCDRCGIYKAEFTIKDLVAEYHKLRCEELKKLEKIRNRFERYDNRTMRM